MSEIFEHREVIEKIAGPELEVTDQWLEDMAELAELASVETHSSKPSEERERIKKARLDFYDELGWTHPDSVYHKGYAEVLRKKRHTAPRPSKLVESFSGLASQGINVEKLTQAKSIISAGGEKNTLNKTYRHIKRLGDLAVVVAAKNNVNVEHFDVAELVNRKPYLLHLSRKQIGHLARSLFGLEYSTLSTDIVANDIRNEKNIQALGKIQRRDKVPLVVSDQEWQGLRPKLINEEKVIEINHWYFLGAEKATHKNRELVHEARAKFVEEFLLGHEDNNMVAVGKALLSHAKERGVHLPKTNNIVGIIELLESIAPSRGIEVLKVRPELLYLLPQATKEKLEVLKETNHNPLAILVSAPHLMRTSLDVFREEMKGRKKGLNAGAARQPAAPLSLIDMPVIERRSKTSHIPSELPNVELDGIDAEVLEPIKQLHKYSEHGSLQDFVNVCALLAKMSPEALSTLVTNVKKIYEADEPCTPRVIARLARELG